MIKKVIEDFFLIFFVISCLLLVGCDKKQMVTRVGTATSSACLNFAYDNLESFLNDVDIFAEVEITEWLGETECGFGNTYYEAKIIHSYKNNTGENLSTIKIFQTGNSSMTFRGYPLFGVGDRMLLGLGTRIN